MRKNLQNPIFSSLFFLMTSLSLFAQAEKGAQTPTKPVRLTDISNFGRPFFRQFTDADGLTVNSVMTVERDRRGYIWAGTQDGVAFFNGHHWTQISLPNRTSSNYVYDILASADGAIWFGTDGGGLHRLQDGQWQTFDTAGGLISNAIRAIFETVDETGQSVIWVGTRDGLSILKNGRWHNFNKNSGLPDNRVRSFAQTADGKVWIGTYGGIIVWQNSAEQLFTKENGLSGNTVFALLHSNGTIWAGTDGGLTKFENGVWTKLGAADGVPEKPVRSLTQSGGSIFAGFDEAGLAVFENSVWRVFDEKSGLANNLIFALEKSGAPDGSVWLSTLGAGLARFERSRWLTFSDLNGLPNKTVFSMAQTAENTFWFGTFGSGAMRFENGVWAKFDSRNGLPDDFVHCFLRSQTADGKEIVYIGTGKGLARFEDGKIFKQALPGETFQEVWEIIETSETDGSKSVWAATGGGLVRWRNGKIETFTTDNGLPDNRVRAILETVSDDGQRIIWLATLGGLAKFSDGRFETFSTADGLPNNRIYGLAEIKTPAGRELWIATGGGGAVRLDLNVRTSPFKTISTETNGLLPNDFVYRIFQDRQNRIYLTTNKGVARLTLNNSTDSQQIQSTFFSTLDGLPANECTAGQSFTDSHGRVWIGTVGGAGLLDLTKEINDKTPDRLHIERILVNGQPRDFNALPEFVHDENNLRFEFALLSGFDENGISYQTQLIGLEEKPTAWSNEPRREFSFLPDGRFIFKIWARDAAGNLAEPLEIPFRIRPAWWRTWWAFGLYLLVFAGVISLISYLFYRTRLQRMIELERVRHRIATDLHDDIGAGLSHISILSDFLATQTEAGDEEKRSLLTIAETSREVTSSMSDIVWAINPNRDNLPDLLQRMRQLASELLSAKDIRFTFKTPETSENQKLDVDLRRQIYLIFKECINNIVKHSNCTKAEIEFRIVDAQYVLRVADNGRGFENKHSKINFGGNGLANMRNRASAAGGTIDISTPETGGTEINLRVPQKSI